MSLADESGRGGNAAAAKATTHFRELAGEPAALAATQNGRQFLKYLVGCALPEGAGTFAIVDRARHEFPGSLGLAPGWLERPLTEAEQRWVSAAILARTNYFGRTVTISMRHPASGFAALEASAAEREEFTLFEGNFFGNLFAEPPVSCVEVGRRTEAERADPILAIRVGTEADPALPPVDGRPVTRCGFVLSGQTDDPAARTFRGVRYEEYVGVYLKPMGLPVGGKQGR